MAPQRGAQCCIMVHQRYVARGVARSQGGGEGRPALLYHTSMTDPLSLSAGIGARLVAGALLLVVLWAAVAWALAI